MTASAPSSVWEVFQVFAKLGLTSFGGPVAHLGYFRAECVQRRRWLDDEEYAELVALCQFLPGPASSQVGFGLGLLRAGSWGGVAAFVGFTLPSATLMVAFAYGAAWLASPIGDGALSGLKIVAVAIVAQAVWGMARTLTPDRSRAAIAVVALLTSLLVAGSIGQLAAILLGAIGGLFVARTAAETRPATVRFPVRPAAGIACLAVFVAVLTGAPLLAAATGSGGLALFDALYRAGSLVFGGGHVVLPLLQAGVVDAGWMSAAQFLEGYGVAQAVPGPLFSFAAYIGAVVSVGPGGVWGALIALVAVFLPGFLLLVGILPFWNSLRRRSWAQAAMRGANAAVVGILAAALYSPVFTTAVIDPGSFGLAVICFFLLVSWKAPPWIVVIIGAAGGILLTLVQT